MKGIIFNALERFIVEQAGRAAYEDVVDQVAPPSGGAYIGPGNYPDAELMGIFTTTVRKLGADPDVILRAFGRFLFGRLMEAVPAMILSHESPKSFLLTLDKVIHVEVRKLYPGANPPSFASEDLGPQRLRLRYRSQRQLPYLALGLIEGAADQYGETVQCELRPEPVPDGPPEWVFDLTFATFTAKTKP